MTPEKFAWGVDIVGPSNLETLLKTIPPYWEAGKDPILQEDGRPDHRGWAFLTQGALAAVPRAPDHEAAADRPGCQRPARQRRRIRTDSDGDEGAQHPRHLRRLPRRRPRFCPSGEQLRFLRHRRTVPRPLPRQPGRVARQCCAQIDRQGRTGVRRWSRSSPRRSPAKARGTKKGGSKEPP